MSWMTRQETQALRVLLLLLLGGLAGNLWLRTVPPSPADSAPAGQPSSTPALPEEPPATDGRF